jgi:predicted RNA binding protein YcfA (HicA-like mRNA interferase family)
MPLNQKRMQKRLEDNGWKRTAGGKHGVKMEKPGHRPITLPTHQGADYSKGLESSILKEAGLK